MIIDKNKKIVQLVAAPTEMTASFEWYNDEIADNETHEYPIACFALIESAQGQRIEPVVMSNGWRGWKLAVASDLKGYQCCFVNDHEPTWTIIETQNGGFCPVDESTAIIIEPEPAIGIRPAWIIAIKDGVPIRLGYYDDIFLAQKQLNHLMQHIMEKDEDYEMKTSKEIQAVLDYEELNEAFRGRAQAFIDAGIHSIKEAKAASDGELTAVKLTGIGKAKRAAYIRQEIAEYEKD